MDADRLTPSRPMATVLQSDGHWHPATILAWCRYRGGWAALLRWPDGSEDWRRHDPRPACVPPWSTSAAGARYWAFSCRACSRSVG